MEDTTIPAPISIPSTDVVSSAIDSILPKEHNPKWQAVQMALEVLKQAKGQFDIDKELDGLKTFKDASTKNYKPPGWSSYGTATYYSDRGANNIRPTLDEMIQDFATNPESADDRVISCSAHGISQGTMYQKWYQGWRWLRENDDRDNKYTKLWHQTYIDQRVKDRVAIRFVRKSVPKELQDTAKHTTPTELKTHKVSHIQPDWRTELDKFFETGTDGTEFLQTNLDMEDDQVGSLKAEMDGLEGFVVIEITAHVIRIVKSAGMWQVLQDLKLKDEQLKEHLT